MKALKVYGFKTEVEEDELGTESENSISSLFNYLDSKESEMRRMMNAAGAIDEIKFKPKLEGRDPRKETAEDWAKIQGGKTMRQVSVEREISYSQIRKRLIAYGYKKPVAKFA